jgi:hypothetical protein
VQPVQLSLLPDQVPAPPVMVTGQLAGEDLTAAVSLLAALIAKMAAGVTGGE